MNLKLITASASVAVLAFGVTAASADTTVIGSTGQSNSQGVNSSQSGENGSSSGGTYILGNSSPTETQTSVNVLANDQEIGGGGVGDDTTLIAPAAGQCFCQLSQQAVNSQQVGVNGDGGGGGTTAILGNSKPDLTQTSVNVGINGQFIGGGPGDTILIGGASQVNQQGTNSSQSGENGSSGGGGTLVIGGNSTGTLGQFSFNILDNEVILGG